MVKKKNKNKNYENDEAEDLEQLLDLKPTTMQFPEGDLKSLRLESATKGVSMGSVLRGLLKRHLRTENQARKRVEAKLYPILKESVTGFFTDRFSLDLFVENMVEEKIKLSDLDHNEWASVLEKFGEISSRNDELDVEEFISKIRCLKPTEDQLEDIQSLYDE